MKTAIIFPGQGVQKIGMGEDFYNEFSETREVFEIASNTLKKDMKKMIFSGSEEEINITSNTQPSIITATVGMLNVFKKYINFETVTSGLSLGEYSSLIYSQSITLEDALPLVEKRGELMINSVESGKGKMAAVLGYDKDNIIKICDEVSKKNNEYIQPANYNSKDQIVISGHSKSCMEVVKILQEKDVKVIPLNVLSPFHTPLLEKASVGLKFELDKIEIKEPNIPMYFNRTGNIETGSENIKKLLEEQVMNPVLWHNTMINMLESGIQRFIEIGPGKTLSGFLKKLPYEYEVLQVNSLSTLEKTINKIGG